MSKTWQWQCWDWRHEQTDILQHVDLWAQNESKTVPSAKGCSVCQKLGGYGQQLPITDTQYDIPCEGECRPDEVPIEFAPCEERLFDEVELNTTISNVSIDSKPVETDGKRGRQREITIDSSARESVVNPDEWPNVDLKPSEGSVKGRQYGRIDGESPYRTTIAA